MNKISKNAVIVFFALISLPALNSKLKPIKQKVPMTLRWAVRIDSGSWTNLAVLPIPFFGPGLCSSISLPNYVFGRTYNETGDRDRFARQARLG